jgi:hypothetical protein
MSDATITYFPVGNGDTVLVRLADKTDILFDCNITEASRDEEDESRYDVHSHLIKLLKKDQAKTPYIDAFILTHPDQDHCRGFTSTFYAGDPAKYGDSHREDDLIRIDELWFTPRLFTRAETDICDEALAFRKEAKRRMKLYRENDPSRSNSGNRLRIIGYSDSPDMEGLEEIISAPGSVVSLINGAVKNDFSFFIHAPFKNDTDSMWGERNLTSVVLQARFDIDGEKHAALAFFGGDAGCDVWENILDRSKDETLAWDLFLAPHHCSWSFFSREPYKDNKIPSKKCIQLLQKKREGAFVVASCKPIKRDDDNPPHYAAKQQYIKIVGEKKFFATGEYPEEKKPLPLEFRLTKNGPQKVDSSSSSAVTSSSAIESAVGTPQTYGE